MTRTVRVDQGEFAPWLEQEISRTGRGPEKLKQPPLITAGYIRLLRNGQRHPSLRAVNTLLGQLGDWIVEDDGSGGSVKAWRRSQDGVAEVEFTRSPRAGSPRKPSRAAKSELSDVGEILRGAQGLSTFLYKARVGQADLSDSHGCRWRVGVRTLGDQAEPDPYVKLTLLRAGEPGGQEVSFSVAAVGERAKLTPAPLQVDEATFLRQWRTLETWVAPDRSRDALVAFPPALRGMFEAMGLISLPRDLAPRPPDQTVTPQALAILRAWLDRVPHPHERPRRRSLPRRRPAART